jgi:hypothetical protein
VEDTHGLCCGTSLFYHHLVKEGLIDENNDAIREFVELTRQHDTWEWKNIYHNEKAREPATLFDTLGTTGYIEMMYEKLCKSQNYGFQFDSLEQTLIHARFEQIREKIAFYCKHIAYKEILGMKAGIIFITYEYRNELAEYFREHNFDMDFAMMIAPDGVWYAIEASKTMQMSELLRSISVEKATTRPLPILLQTNSNKQSSIY